MLKIYNEATAMVDSISAKITKIQDSSIITETFVLGNSSFNLSSISDKQKVYLGSLLSSRLAGAKLFRDKELTEMVQDEISEVLLAVEQWNELETLHSDMYSYRDIAREAKGLFSEKEKKDSLRDKLKSLK